MHSFQLIGNYKKYTECRSCKNASLSKVIDLGYVPLAGGFIEKKNLKNIKEYFYPLTLSLCNNCKTLQTTEVINQDRLFKDYYYHSSSIKTLVNHFNNNAEELRKKVKNSSNKFIIEIGCNDGSFIKALREKKFKTLGIDPATNIVAPLIKKGFPIINDYFSSKLASEILKKYEKADFITSSNTLAHIENIYDVFIGIKKLLKKKGELIMEVHYLKTLIEQFQYDMIYHEHQYYWSTLSLSKVLDIIGLQINDLKLIPTHAGSIRFYIGHKGVKNISNNVKLQIKAEKELGLDKALFYKSFLAKINSKKIILQKLLEKIISENKTIAGYGASGRGTILSAFSNLNESTIKYIIDDSKAKQGAYTPGNHLRIVSSKILNEPTRPDYVLLFAWSFIDEIKKRNSTYLNSGGKFIVPLPKVKIVDFLNE